MEIFGEHSEFGEKIKYVRDSGDFDFVFEVFDALKKVVIFVLTNVKKIAGLIKTLLGLDLLILGLKKLYGRYPNSRWLINLATIMEGSKVIFVVIFTTIMMFIRPDKILEKLGLDDLVIE